MRKKQGFGKVEYAKINNKRYAAYKNIAEKFKEKLPVAEYNKNRANLRKSVFHNQLHNPNS